MRGWDRESHTKTSPGIEISRIFDYFISFLFFFFLYIESISSVGIEAAVNFFERFVGGHPPMQSEVKRAQ